MAKKQIRNFILILIVFLTFQKCANQVSPPGGDDDKIPPTVIETYPTNGTLNFTEQFVEFSFSEYVDKNTIRDAVFISPIIDGVLEFSWTNKTVEITFPDSLKKNTTYSVIVGTEVKDINNRNPMKAPYILTFSTGSIIDSGKISGIVYSNDSEGTLVFAYKNYSDTLDILEDKPSYISQVDEKGDFSLVGLGFGKYKVFAIKDEFKNNVYNIGEDKIGIQSEEIELKGRNGLATNLNFFIEKDDTLEPHLQKVTMTDKNHIVIEFNEAIDSSKLSINNFTIYDSTNSISYSLKKLFKGNKKNQFILGFLDSLNLENSLFLNVTNIFDINENKLQYESNSFIPSDKPDTAGTNIDRFETKFGRNTIDYLRPQFEIFFNDSFDTLSAKRGIKLETADSIHVPIKLTILDDASIRVNTIEDLKPQMKYFALANLKYFEDISGNKVDTTIKTRLLTISKFEFTGALGKVITSNKKNVKVKLQSLARGGSDYQVNLKDDLTFKFERIVPGEYLVWAYFDEDSNNIYSSGSVEPFKLAEKFSYYPDTLNLKARWPIGDIIIDLK